MPFVMLLFGAVLAVSAYRGTTEDLFALLEKDFTGDSNFLYWMASIAGVGLIGYVPGLQTFSRLIFILLLIVVVVSNKGLFAQFASALQTSTVTTVADAPKANDPRYVQWSAPGSGGSGGGDGGGGSDIGSIISEVAPIALALL